jgi:hypothetical protein
VIQNLPLFACPTPPQELGLASPASPVVDLRNVLWLLIFVLFPLVPLNAMGSCLSSLFQNTLLSFFLGERVCRAVKDLFLHEPEQMLWNAFPPSGREFSCTPRSQMPGETISWDLQETRR